MRTNDRVAAFQQALDVFEIPSVLEGGRDFFEREETAAVLAVLSALDDPRDAVSVYAALKSAFLLVLRRGSLSRKERGRLV